MRLALVVLVALALAVDPQADLYVCEGQCNAPAEFCACD